MDMREYIAQGQYIAKSNPVKSIAEHTEELIKGFDSFFIIYDGGYFTDEQKELIRIACEYHDYGKTIYPFQHKIHKNIGLKMQLSSQRKNVLDSLYKKIPNYENIPHGYISPAFLDIESLEDDYGELTDPCLLLVLAIFYHHERDFDLTDSDIRNIIKQDLNMDITCTYFLEYISMKNKLRYTDFWLKFSIIKGLLNKFDYHASSGSDSRIEYPPYFNNRCIADNVSSKYEKLRPVQKYMRDNSGKNLIVTASTGIGKTEAALLWSNGSKTFYTLPLKVSINAIYDRIRKNYTNDTHGVTLLHSDSLSYLTEHELSEENNSDLALQKYKDSKMLSYPFIVCTIDQLFAFTYKAAGSEILLATLKYSKLIIDEIQSYSSEIIAKILYGLKLICDVGGKFAIITATMPPVFEYFINELKIPYEKAEYPFYSAVTKHHRIKYIKSDIDIELIKSQDKDKKVLVICNTVKKAQEIYSKIIETEDINVHLLHSQFIQKHRSILETQIMEFSKDKTISGIWITTQIVEASLDIDFDLLVTEMCPGDSLLQRMGRCHRNRECEYTDSIPNVLIYDTGNGYGTVYRHKEIYDLSVQELMRYDGEIFTEEDKSAYINNIYNVDTLGDTEYFKEIANKIKDMQKIIPRHYTLNEAKKQIRDIQSVTVIPDSLYLEANKYGDASDDELRTLTLNLYKYSKKAMFRDIMSIRKNLDIYRIAVKYEFDENTCKGLGLCGSEDFDIQSYIL